MGQDKYHDGIHISSTVLCFTVPVWGMDKLVYAHFFKVSGYPLT